MLCLIIPGVPHEKWGIELLTMRANKSRKYGDYRICRDLIVTDMEHVYVNGAVYPFSKETFDELVEAHTKRTHTDTRLRVWVWELHAHIKELKSVIRDNVVPVVQRNNRYGTQYIVLSHLILSNIKYIINDKMDVVKLRKITECDETVPDVVALAKYIENYLSKRRYSNPQTETYASAATSEIFKHMSEELREELRHDTYDNKRCPDSRTVHEMILSNKSGILYYKQGIEEQLLKDVYSYDSSSYYPSQLFSDDFPTGPLVRCKEYDAKLLKLAISNGWWFVVHGISKECITMECNVLRPASSDTRKEYYVDDDGYYHYTIAPYDYLTLRDFFGINIFEDNRITWTGLSICKKTGRLNKHFLDYIMEMYEKKDNATDLDERQRIKDGLNMLLGKSYPRTLLQFDKHAKWYCQPEHYVCPQYGLHMVSKARYDTMKLASKIGRDNVTALVTDSIKSQDPRLPWIIANHNTAHRDYMRSLGYDNTNLGIWKDESYKYLVYFTNNVYVTESKADGKCKAIISGCHNAKTEISQFSDLFKSDVIKDGTIVNIKGERHYQDRQLWSCTDNRLKARELYEMDKSDQGV